MNLFHHAGLENWYWGDLEPNAYDFIMMDNAWKQVMRSEKGEKKSPQSKYRTMTIEEMAALPVLDLAAPDCVLWFWTMNNLLPQALYLIERYGFTFKTAGTWLKTTKNGKIAFGTGYILRGSSEPYIIATRGKPKTTKAVRGGFTGMIREHSRKPEEAYANAEKLMPNARRVELFSKTNRPGWSTFGDEAGTWTAE